MRRPRAPDCHCPRLRATAGHSPRHHPAPTSPSPSPQRAAYSTVTSSLWVLELAGMRRPCRAALRHWPSLANSSVPSRSTPSRAPSPMREYWGEARRSELVCLCNYKPSSGPPRPANLHAEITCNCDRSFSHRVHSSTAGGSDAASHGPSACTFQRCTRGPSLQRSAGTAKGPAAGRHWPPEPPGVWRPRAGLCARGQPSRVPAHRELRPLFRAARPSLGSVQRAAGRHPPDSY